MQQYAGLLLESLRGAALGLLQGSFAGDQAPWLEGPHKASVAGSLCALTVRPGWHITFSVVKGLDSSEQDSFSRHLLPMQATIVLMPHVVSRTQFLLKVKCCGLRSSSILHGGRHSAPCFFS